VMGRISLNSNDSCLSANLTVVVVDFLVENEELRADSNNLEAAGSLSSSSSSSRLSIPGNDGKDGTARSSAAWIRLQTRDGVSNTGMMVMQQSDYHTSP